MGFNLSQTQLDIALVMASCRMGNIIGGIAEDTMLGTNKTAREAKEREFNLFLGVIDLLERFEVGGTNCSSDDTAQLLLERLSIYTGICIDDIDVTISGATFFLLQENGGLLLQENEGNLIYI